MNPNERWTHGKKRIKTKKESQKKKKLGETGVMERA